MTSNNSISNLESWFEQLKIKTQKYIELRSSALKKRNEEREAVRKLKKEISALVDAQSLVQHISEEIQNTVNREIAAVVSKCLSSIFDDPYDFLIPFSKKRGKTEAKLVFERDGLVLDDPKESLSYGVIDIAVLALRLACILRSMPQLRRFIVLDEPFKHLHANLRPMALKLVLELAKETKTQFVIVTHLISKKKLKKLFKKCKIIDLT